VICDQKPFAQDGLPISMRYWSKQVGRGVGDESTHCRQVRTKRINRLIPGAVIGRAIAARPITLGPGGRDVLRIAAKFQDVPLGDSHMLQETPRAVRHRSNRSTAEVAGDIRHRFVETDVGAATAEEVKEVLTESAIFVHRTCPSGSKSIEQCKLNGVK